MSAINPPSTFHRHSLAELLSRNLSAAWDPSDAASDGVTAAAAERLRQWPREADAPAGTAEDWARPSSVVTCDEFLAPGEVSALCEYVLSRRDAFAAGSLVSTERSDVFVDRSFRAAETLVELGPFRELFEKRIERYLPFVGWRLGLPPFGEHWYELQLTAIRDRGFFRRHDDNSHPGNATRRITCVYYFYCSPLLPFGGELRFAPDRPWNGPLEVRPLANRMVFFDSSVPHEVLPVRAGSDRLEAARFTMNGWVHEKR